MSASVYFTGCGYFCEDKIFVVRGSAPESNLGKGRHTNCFCSQPALAAILTSRQNSSPFIFSLCRQQNRQVGISLFPDCQEICICLTRRGGVARKCQRTRQA